MKINQLLYRSEGKLNIQHYAEYQTMSYRVIEEFKTLCCAFPCKIGEVIEVLEQTSKNRLIIEKEIGRHKVKRSTFFRCTEPVSKEMFANSGPAVLNIRR